MRRRSPARRGVAAVEAAIVYPLVFFLLLGMVVGSMGVFRYQEMATLAREAARYAAVHGTEYGKANSNNTPTPQDIFNAAVVPKAVGLDLSALSYEITYNASNAPKQSVVENGEVKAKQNIVRVKLTYLWVPEAFLGGITLTSTAEMPMAY